MGSFGTGTITVWRAQKEKGVEREREIEGGGGGGGGGEEETWEMGGEDTVVTP